MNDSPPPIDPNLLDVRIKPLGPQKPKASPSVAVLPNDSTKNSSEPKAAPKKSPPIQSLSQLDPKTTESKSPVLAKQKDSPESHDPDEFHNSAVENNTDESNTGKILLCAIVVFLLVIGLHFTGVSCSRTTENESLVQQQKELFEKEKNSWREEKARLESEIQRLQIELRAQTNGRVNKDQSNISPATAQPSRTKTSPVEPTHNKQPPSIIVRATINGKNVPGAILNFAGKDRVLPKKLVLKSDTRYAGGIISAKVNGISYSGRLDAFRTNWNGERVKNIELERDAPDFSIWDDSTDLFSDDESMPSLFN